MADTDNPDSGRDPNAPALVVNCGTAGGQVTSTVGDQASAVTNLQQANDQAEQALYEAAISAMAAE